MFGHAHFGWSWINVYTKIMSSGDGGSAANTDIASQASSCSPTAPLGPPELSQATDTRPVQPGGQSGAVAQQPAGSDANPPRVSSRQISGHRQDNRQETGGIMFSDPRGAVNDEAAIQQQPFEYRIVDNYEPPPPYPGLPRSLSATERNTARSIAACNMFQHAASVPIMRTARGNRSINTQLIPSIDGDPNTRYAKQMNYSLCLLIVCLALCNISSLIFTLPSIVCAWKAVQASMNDQYQAAEKNKKVALVCFWMAVTEFIVLILSFALILGLVLLIESDILLFNVQQ